MAKRKFVSEAVERQLSIVKASIGDPKLAWMFENCYPNTLDTTVELGTFNGKPDTFVITGDIDAMWLRDSSAQVVPYIPLRKAMPALQRLVSRLDSTPGTLHSHRSRMLMPSCPTRTRHRWIWARHDSTDMKPGVGERKWEIDSLCYPIRLAHGYWQATAMRALRRRLARVPCIWS
jgi:meiotically up-regulated gene 157 (Mug157) protein